jgi:ABC-type nitrate/sulfonate/bicarbonate transport system substrate-binding protein
MRWRREWWLAGAIGWLLACAPAAGTAPSGGTGSAAAPAGPAGSSAAAAPTAVVEVQKVPVVLSALSATNTPLWVAAEYGIFQRYGIEPEFNQLSPSAASQALSAGSAPVGVTGGSSISAWVSGARDRVFIAGLIDKALFKILTNTPGVTRIEDIRGKSIGTTTPGSGGTLALFAALRRFNVEPNRDVDVTYLRDQPTVLNSMMTGATAAGNLPPPFTEQGLADGARQLMDMRDLDIRVAVNHITSTRGEVERNRDFLKRFLMAYVEGIQFARDNPNEAVEAIMKGTRQDSRADAEEAYRLNRDVWNPWPSEEGVQVVLDNSDIPDAKNAVASGILDLSIMRELESSGWLAAHYKP